jgi:nucleotide-binding universal stress UspA family protein
MSEVILVIVSRTDTATVLLDAAAQLASLIGETARINALAPHEETHAQALSHGASPGPTGGITLRSAFEAWAARVGRTSANARWYETERMTLEVIAERGARSDFVVAELPQGGDASARGVLRAALFGTGRPVLVVPAKQMFKPFGRRIAIAWRNDKQVARAVIPVLRWLSAADGVHVLAGLQPGAVAPEMPRVFLEHGIDAELHRLPLGSRPFGQVLLDEVHALGADLLVMGAYAHSPLRELILGGTTRYILEHTDVPVLMRH